MSPGAEAEAGSHAGMSRSSGGDVNPIGYMPNLSMRGVDNSIKNETMLSA
jgi:hypothetical protein